MARPRGSNDYNECVKNCNDLFAGKDAALVACINGCAKCTTADTLASVGDLPNDVIQVRDKVQKVKKLNELLSEELEGFES